MCHRGCCEEHTNLWNVAGWVHADGNRLVVESVAIQVKEVKEELAEMMSGVKVAALNFGHHLQHAHDQADHGEAADASVDWLVETTHQEELLDQSDQCGHTGVLRPPGLECVDGSQSCAVLERDVNLEARLVLDELDQRHLGVENKLNLVFPGDVAGNQLSFESIQSCFCVIPRRAAVRISVRHENQVHVGSGQVQT